MGILEESEKIIQRGLVGVKKPLLAFSGGKDATVVALIAAKFGICDAVCEESFYFKMQREDTRAIAARLGLRCRFYDSLSLEWLAAHPEHLFQRNSAIVGRYFAIRQQATVARHAAKYGYDAVLFGRRNDENTVKADVYKLANKRTQIMPVRYWHEADIWAFLAENNIKKPRIYATVFGENRHNAPWNVYNAHSDPIACFKDLAKIEKSIVQEAARFFPAARIALTGK